MSEVRLETYETNVVEELAGPLVELVTAAARAALPHRARPVRVTSVALVALRGAERQLEERLRELSSRPELSLDE